MKLNNKTLRGIQLEIDRCLKDLGKKHDLVFKMCGGSFDQSGLCATLKMEVSARDEDGEIKTKESIAWGTHCRAFGFEPHHLGKKFKTWNGEYTICGLKTRARKYPILGKDAQGKIFKFPETVVLNGLDLANAAESK